MDGDWRTDLLEVFELEGFFFFDVRTDDEPGADIGALNSTFMSIGDVVSDVSDLGSAPYMDWWPALFCASNAGDVSGLKYSQGTANSGY